MYTGAVPDVPGAPDAFLDGTFLRWNAPSGNGANITQYRINARCGVQQIEPQQWTPSEIGTCTKILLVYILNSKKGQPPYKGQ